MALHFFSGKWPSHTLAARGVVVKGLGSLKF
jgi:hypothetical protein